MDNIETTEPVGEEGATSSPDNSAINTQPTESSDSVSDGKEAEVVKADSSPWEDDPRFKGKTEADRYKSYRELEGKLGVREENSKLVKMLEEQTNMSASQIREKISEINEQKLQQQYAQNPAPFLASKISQLESTIALQAEEKKLGDFLETNPEYAPFKEEIKEFAYMPKYQGMSYEDIARDKIGKIIARGQETAYKKIETKQNTQSSGVRTAPKKSMSLDDLRNMPPSERIKAMEIIYG